MGSVQLLPVGPTPTVVIDEVEGDLQVVGWDRPELQVRGPKADEISRHGDSDEIYISARRNCVLQAPLQTTLRVGKVEGNAAINMLLGAVEVEDVDGNFAANSTGPLTLGKADGNVSVRSVAGALTTADIDGNARIAQIAGDLRLGNVDGNLVISEVVGNVQATCDGNVDLRLNLAPGQHVQVAADGNIDCRIQADAGVVVRLKADGNIRVRNLGEPRRDEDTCLEFVLGDGGAILDLHADGDITLTGIDMPPFSAGFDAAANQEMNEEMARRAAELGQQIAQQVESQVNVLTRDLEEKLSKMGDNEEMANKIQDRVSMALRRAEEKLAEAMRKMEVRAEETAGARATAGRRRYPPRRPRRLRRRPRPSAHRRATRNA
ncbi:MAG: hypothetical protein U0X20_15075 [Caldilineaceae bacterium]